MTSKKQNTAWVKGLKRWLVGGWPDEARLLVQSAAFRKVLGENRLAGECLNAGAGEGLYSGFIEGFEGVKSISNIDLTCPTISAVRKDPRHRDYAGSLTNLPFQDGQFDSAICTEVLEHIDDDDAAIRELARVLKSGGLLLISVPTPPAPHDPAHVREGYSVGELEVRLKKHNLDVVSQDFCLHDLMRILLIVWRWQFELFGRRKRSLLPRILLIMIAKLDIILRLGKPWDLVVLACKTPNSSATL